MMRGEDPALDRLRRATTLGWAAVACYAGAVLCLALIFFWLKSGLLAIGLAVVGFALQRAAAFQRRSADRNLPAGKG